MMRRKKKFMEYDFGDSFILLYNLHEIWKQNGMKREWRGNLLEIKGSSFSEELREVSENCRKLLCERS
jgi:hypothetical protein